MSPGIGKKQQRSHKETKGTAENTANGHLWLRLQRAKDQWLPVVVDWPVGLAALDDFLCTLARAGARGLAPRWLNGTDYASRLK